MKKWSKQTSEDVLVIIREYEEIIRTKKKNITATAFQHGRVLKRFKEKETFLFFYLFFFYFILFIYFFFLSQQNTSSN